MKYKIFGNRIKLYDSCFVPKSQFKTELDRIRNLHPTCNLWKRSIGSIRREWAAHNLAYALGINREKTASVDLDYEPRWYHRLFYGVVGTVALLFIK